MQRTIVGFYQDEEEHWVAKLDCHHGQHMRHTPPFYERPWVLTEEERNSRIGTEVECVKCNQFEWPEDLVPFKRTPEFTEETIPQGLQNDHATKRGIWAKINIVEGELLYRPHIGESIRLSPGQSGIIVPTMTHSVEPIDSVCFFVEFYRPSER